MAKRGLAALADVRPSTAQAIEGDLVGAGKPIPTLTAPSPVTQEWLEVQKAPLTVGALKAIAAPFYDHLHEDIPQWLRQQRLQNGTLPSGIRLGAGNVYPAPYGKYPWTSVTTDDANSAPATISQLKAVFALRFETCAEDSDGDGLVDEWEYEQFDTLSQNSAGDFDGDGFSNLEEYLRASSPVDPNDGDSDADGLPDAWEIAQFGNLDESGTNDPDNDGLTNFEERALNTDPEVANAALADTDDDGLPDVYEAAHGLQVTMDDSLEDADGDRFPNIFEYKNGASASDFESRPQVDLVVDKARGAESATDNIFPTISAAADSAMYGDLEDPESVLRSYQTIFIRAGTYPEHLFLTNIPLLLLGELSATAGPVVIAGDDFSTVYLEHVAVLDGLVITHMVGKPGRGVDATFYDWDPENPFPATFKKRRLVNCVIRGNTGEYGGGIEIQGADVSMVHCTVTGNAADGTTPGINVWNNGSLTLLNSIVSGNNSNLANPDARQVFVENGSMLNMSATWPNLITDENTDSVPGWLDSLDPALVPGGWLAFTSGAIDAAGAIGSSPVMRDLNGELRHVAVPDIGADEYLDENLVTDADGVPDWKEGPDDFDALSAFAEYNIHGSDPLITDTDGDGMNDGGEVVKGLDPTVAEDNDGDGMLDAWELAQGLDPTFDDSLHDSDGDRIPNVFEFKNGLTDASDVESVPEITFHVNPASGNAVPDDNIFATIWEALDAVSFRDEDEDGEPDPYPIILVHAGVYEETIELSDVPILMLGELGADAGPVQILGHQTGTTVTINTSSVMNGFIISHKPGFTGSGVAFVLDSWRDPIPARMVNCIVRQNTSLLAAGISVSNFDLGMEHCTVTGNTSTWFWPGINVYSGNLSLANCVVSGNIGAPTTTNNKQVDHGGTATVTLSEGAPSFISDTPANPTSGWISEAPGIAPTGFATGKYSRCVDSGRALSTSQVLQDIQGEVRPSGDAPDPGADEFLVPSDADGDGLPDDWEDYYGLNIEDDVNGILDSDGDRVPDRWEYEHGTDPLDPESRVLAHWVVNPALAGTGNNVATIQQAIDNAPELGDTISPHVVIEVRRGVYAEHVVIPANKRVVLLGELGYPETEISGPSPHDPVLKIEGRTFVDGFRISRSGRPMVDERNARGIQITMGSDQGLVALSNLLVHGHCADRGGAISVNSGRIKIKHVTVFGCLSNHYGSGLSVGSGANVEIHNSIFQGLPGDSVVIDKDPDAVISVYDSFIQGGWFGADGSDPELTPRGWIRKGSPVIDAGGVAGCPADIHNDVRTGPADVGADEYVDADDDGLPDWLEDIGVTNPSADNDSDGLSNLVEYESHGTNPLAADSDGDGLSDGDEASALTDSFLSDTDGDGMSDGWENLHGLDPNDAGDAMADSDGDRIPNLWEFNRGTSPVDVMDRPAPNWIVTQETLFSGNKVDSIQQAIENTPANSSDPNYYSIIEVQPGIYPENVVIPADKRITLLGQPGYRVAEIVGLSDSRRVLTIHSLSHVDGFRIARPEKLRGNGFKKSGGIHVAMTDPSHQVVLSNLLIHGHRADSGAGLFLQSGRARLQHSTIHGTAAYLSGNAIQLTEGTAIEVYNSIIHGENGPAPEQIAKANGAEFALYSCFVKGGEFSGNSANPGITPQGWLRKGALAIDSGMTSKPDRDIHGEARNSAADAGTDEFIDSDDDGLPDWLEALGVHSAGGDDDMDGLSNLLEFETYGTDPLQSDTDGDGVEDGEEIAGGTDPLDRDSDGDGLSDGFENLHVTNPLDPDENNNNIPDGGDDSDSDGATNEEEEDAGSNPEEASPVDDATRAFSNLTFTVIPLATLPETGWSDFSIDTISDAGDVSFTEYHHPNGDPHDFSNLIVTPHGVAANRGGYYAVPTQLPDLDPLDQLDGSYTTEVKSRYSPGMGYTPDLSLIVPTLDHDVIAPVRPGDFAGFTISHLVPESAYLYDTVEGGEPISDLVFTSVNMAIAEDGSLFLKATANRTYSWDYTYVSATGLYPNPSPKTITELGKATENYYSWGPEGVSPMVISGTFTLPTPHPTYTGTLLHGAGGMGADAFAIVDEFEDNETVNLTLRARSGTIVDLTSKGIDGNWPLHTSRNGHIVERNPGGGVLYNYKDDTVESLPAHFATSGASYYVNVNDIGDILVSDEGPALDVLSRKVIDPVTEQGVWVKCEITSDRVSGGWHHVDVHALANTMSQAQQLELEGMDPPAYPPAFEDAPIPLLAGTAYRDGKKYPVLLIPITTDLDIDSDNNGSVDSSKEEDAIESDPAYPGKVIATSSVTGQDPMGIPDSESDVNEVRIEVTQLHPEDTITFTYSGSDPMETISGIGSNGDTIYSNAPGALRLWKKHEGGLPASHSDYIVPGHPYQLSELGIVSGEPQIFYIQAIANGPLREEVVITTQVGAYEVKDTVVVSILPVEIRHVDRDDYDAKWNAPAEINAISTKVYAGRLDGDMIEWTMPYYEGSEWEDFEWYALDPSGNRIDGPSGPGINTWAIRDFGRTADGSDSYGNDPQNDKWLKWRPGRHKVMCKVGEVPFLVSDIDIGWRTEEVVVIGQIVPTISHNADKPSGTALTEWSKAIADDLTYGLEPGRRIFNLGYHPTHPLHHTNNELYGKLETVANFFPEKMTEGWMGLWSNGIPGLLPPEIKLLAPGIMVPPALPPASRGPLTHSFGTSPRGSVGTITASQRYWMIQHTLNVNSDFPLLPDKMVLGRPGDPSDINEIRHQEQYRIFHRYQAKFFLSNDGKINGSRYEVVESEAIVGKTKLNLNFDWAENGGIPRGIWEAVGAPEGGHPFLKEAAETNENNENITHAPDGRSVSSFATGRIGEKGRFSSYRLFGKDAPWIFSEIIHEVQSDRQIKLKVRTSITSEWDEATGVVYRAPTAPPTTTGNHPFNNLNIYTRNLPDGYGREIEIMMDGHLAPFVESTSGAWPEPPIPPSLR